MKLIYSIILFVILYQECSGLSLLGKNLKSNENNTCGMRRTDIKVKAKKALGFDRVVGGVDANDHEFPWLVSFQIWLAKKKRIEHFCGGSIISDRWILTAAHCFERFKEKETWKPIMVKMGSNLLYNVSTTNYTISHVEVHKGWSNETQANDIALVQLKNKISFTNVNKIYHVNTVCIPDKKFESGVNDTLTLAGFGQLGEHDKKPDNLQKLDVPVYNHKNCIKNYQEVAPNVNLKENKMCAGGKGQQDSCMGDSGGPLMFTIDNRVHLIGIVSFGLPCAQKDFPGVYTKVAKYYDWIVKNAKN